MITKRSGVFNPLGQKSEANLFCCIIVHSWIVFRNRSLSYFHRDEEEGIVVGTYRVHMMTTLLAYVWTGETYRKINIEIKLPLPHTISPMMVGEWNSLDCWIQFLWIERKVCCKVQNNEHQMAIFRELVDFIRMEYGYVICTQWDKFFDGKLSQCKCLKQRVVISPVHRLTKNFCNFAKTH